ncbi:MAG: YihY family inner membrane protein [Betaproteobacteria bacterium]|nr:YihY family inner membrane protein [Betaproteobacteria bacterium]NBT74596.1 YihY family inner membrane protein [Betaproteobacteria bacterium]NBY13938.1 YihY family inner membrane protein [Betaproteobacteria bacterium]NCA16392.1 YihY family inner membrane protein [Betaproteobacteria bacterium]NDF04716.1 YihY family inner membrane protein [Betaproteobacteria bacterium]
MDAFHQLLQSRLGLFVVLVWRRFWDLRLGQAAASLSFSWLLAMVPLITVSLALVTSLSNFEDIRKSIQALIFEHFLPQGLGGQISRYLDQFVRKAASLSLVGFALLSLSATFMMLTLDRTLNLIWDTARPRPLAKRIAIYWVALLLGPIAAGLGTSLLSWLAGSPREFGTLFGLAWWDWTNIALTALAYTFFYRFLPNTRVEWSHAAWGGAIAAVLTEVAQQVFGGVLVSVPTYRQIYGPLAAIPLLLIWTYLNWWLFLLGALLASLMPQWQRSGASMGLKEITT